MPQEVVVQRFWSTLILYDLIQERGHHVVAKKFGITPGQVQQCVLREQMDGTVPMPCHCRTSAVDTLCAALDCSNGLPSSGLKW
jgi:hypothetical protein